MKSRLLLWVTLFAISMGIFEGAVVVYIRALYYPGGFDFPLKLMSNQIAMTELIREFASLIMLLSVGIIAGKNLAQRFAWFIYSFAVWDIVYYLFLYLILQWPESFFTWDILFLLPVTWTGPVIAPIIISILMIILAMVIYHNSCKGLSVKISRKEWVLLILGSFVVFISFVWDYCRFIFQNFSELENLGNDKLEKIYELSFQYIPVKFPWVLFFVGIIIISTGIYILYLRHKKSAS